MPTVLSTKILSASQKELLLNAGLNFVETDGINIVFTDYQLPSDFDYLIFTSKNAVKSYTIKEKSDSGKKIKAFCVGEKTKLLLERRNISVERCTENAADLAQEIVENYPKKRFLFLSGNQRRNELPEILKENNIRYNEIEAYHTHLTPKRFERSFDGILFFSPSGVESFTSKNSLNDAMAFCIGPTTANEALKYTDKIIIANTPTIENVLVQAIKHFKDDD